MIITVEDRAITMSHAGNDKRESLNVSRSGVDAIIAISPNPKRRETVIILFLNMLDLKIMQSVLTEIKKNSCKKFSV